MTATWSYGSSSLWLNCDDSNGKHHMIAFEAIDDVEWADDSNITWSIITLRSGRRMTVKLSGAEFKTLLQRDYK